MTFKDDGRIKAVYTGESHTVHGKEQHKFVNVGPTKIAKDKVEKIKEYITEV